MPVLRPEWMPQSIQPLRKDSYSHHTSSNGETLLKKQLQWWRISHIHRCRRTRRWGQLNCLRGMEGFPEVATSYISALHFPFSFPAAFLAVFQISYQTRCHHSLSWFLHNLKNNYRFPTLAHPASQLRERNIITLLGQNHHLLERFQYFLLKSTVIPGQVLRNLPKSLEEQDASWWVAGL